MKRLVSIVIILAATGVGAYAGLVVLYWIMVFVHRWPSQETMVRSGYRLIPEAEQIDDLLGPAWHQTSNYSEPDIVEWQTDALFGGRYELIMLVPLRIDRRSGNVLKVLGKPEFVLCEIVSITLRPDGSIEGVSNGESHQFGLTDWQKVVAAKGDFSGIGVQMKRGGAVANFDKYQTSPRNGIQMGR